VSLGPAVAPYRPVQVPRRVIVADFCPVARDLEVCSNINEAWGVTAYCALGRDGHAALALGTSTRDWHVLMVFERNVVDLAKEVRPYSIYVYVPRSSVPPDHSRNEHLSLLHASAERSYSRLLERADEPPKLILSRDIFGLGERTRTRI
jgi:hypothetical protein